MKTYGVTFVIVLFCFLCSAVNLPAQNAKTRSGEEQYFEKKVSFPKGASSDQKVRLSARVIPSAEQLAWQKLEMTAFLHFTVNTFTDKEWGNGQEDPRVFNPTQLNAGQWVKTMKDAGARLVILTCKHHDGFCLWPTKTTKHSVAYSSWKNGKGDVVREVRNACNKYGVKFGVYLSPWDRNSPYYGNSPVYNNYFMAQLTELLSNYGKVDEVWFDGACGEGPNGKKQEYDWESYYKLIHRLQPHAVIAVTGEDVRWVGTESGYGRESEWSVTPLAPGGTQTMREINARLGISDMTEDLGSRKTLEKADYAFWYPAEVDVSIRPGWFYHTTEDNQVKSLNKLVDIYFSSVGRNAVLLLNVPPDRRGLIHENDVKRLKEFRNYLNKTFSHNLLLHAQTTTPGASAAVDGNYSTAWNLPATTGNAIFISKGTIRFNTLMIQEDISRGQRVEGFTVEAYRDGKWKEISRSTTIGYKKLLRFPGVSATRIRLSITGARDLPHIATFALYNAPELISDPIINRNKQGEVSIQCESPYAVVKYTLDGSDPDADSPSYSQPIALPRGGIVKAKAFIDNFKQHSATVTEEFFICPAKWKVVSADSENDGTEAYKAIDGDSNTLWHTRWTDPIPKQPHQIIISLGEELTLDGFTYTPRNDGNTAGTVSRYEFWISQDGKNWEKTDVPGEFSNIKNNPVQQIIRFKQPCKARYFKFVSLEEVNGKAWTSAAEIGVISQ